MNPPTPPEQKHTPLPWLVATNYRHEQDGAFYIVTEAQTPIAVLDTCSSILDEANAHFIVKAVNSHAADQERIRVLTEALEKSVNAHKETTARFDRVATVAFGKNGIPERTMNDLHVAKNAILAARQALSPQ